MEQTLYMEAAEEVAWSVLEAHLDEYQKNTWDDRKHLPLVRIMIEQMTELLEEKGFPEDQIEQLEEDLIEKTFEKFLEHCLERRLEHDDRAKSIRSWAREQSISS